MFINWRMYQCAKTQKRGFVIKYLMRSFCTFIILLALSTTAVAQSKNKIIFGVPSWPGVTVKSEVVAQLLEAMGYDVKQIVASPSIIFSSLSSDSLQVYLGGWSPVEDPMIDPLVKKKKIIKAGLNIQGAVTSLAVPTYVYDAGVTSVEDLDQYREKFDKTIYSLSAGTGFSKELHTVKDENVAGLGDWKLAETSTSIMLAEVFGKVKRHEWVVFYGWAPHWMNVMMEMKFLESKTEGTAAIGATESIVYTITSAALPETHPQVFAMMEQFKVPTQVQSNWIYEYKHEKRTSKKVAHEWIMANIDGLVAEWLTGITALDGRPAIEAIHAAF